jgi:hypothetical protein
MIPWSENLSVSAFLAAPPGEVVGKWPPGIWTVESVEEPQGYYYHGSSHLVFVGSNPTYKWDK